MCVMSNVEGWADQYLARIGYQGAVDPGLETLKKLHQHHLLRVPFENLDIQWQRPLSLDIQDLFQKIVGDNRGGFCYEMNHMFGSLLKELGFEVVYIAAQVYNEQQPGDYFDHMALVVNGEWLCDIGFGGGSFMRPLSLSSKAAQADPGGQFRIKQLDEKSWLLSSALKTDEDFKPVYYFDLIPRKIDEFQPECIRKQQDPTSSFVTRKICTMATDKGRVSLLNEELTIREGADKTIIKVEDAQQEAQLLWEYFKVRSPWL